MKSNQLQSSFLKLPRMQSYSHLPVRLYHLQECIRMTLSRSSIRRVEETSSPRPATNKAKQSRVVIVKNCKTPWPIVIRLSQKINNYFRVRWIDKHQTSFLKMLVIGPVRRPARMQELKISMKPTEYMFHHQTKMKTRLKSENKEEAETC